MNEKTKTGLEILQAALLLGILGDVMLRAGGLGLNALLLMGGTAAAMVMLFLRRRRDVLDRNTWALIGALVFFSAMFAWRDSPQLLFADILAMVVIFAVLALPVLRIKVSVAGVAHYIFGFLISSINAFFAPVGILVADIKWGEMPKNGWSKHLVSVVRGVLIAVPLILIFGALFVAADAAFENLVTKTFNINPEVIISHIFVTGLLAWLAAGYLRGTLVETFAGSTADAIITAAAPDVMPSVTSVTELPSEEPQENAKPAPEEKGKKPRDWQNFDNSVLPKSFTLDSVEIGVVLGLVDLLFLAFVIVQLPYLFGGMDFVQNTPDFKLAEFARRGFGELVAVAAIVLPVLLVSHWLLRKDSPLALKLFRVLAGVQVALLFVIMASAAQRIFLLTGPLGYGMTTLRFYPLVFMIWLAVVFGWFAVTVMRGAREHFAWGALWSALILLGALHVFNPDAFIARTNIALMQKGREYDAVTNAHLSADAMPVLIESLPLMALDDQEKTRSVLSKNIRIVCRENDFRIWNWSRSKAKALIDREIGAGHEGTCSEFHGD